MSIGTFYQRFAHATMDEPGTRDLLFDYSVAKIFVSPDSMTITSWFCDGGPNIDFAGLAEAKKTWEVLNIEFNTSPQVFGRDAAFHYFVGFGHESKLSHLSAFLVVEMARIELASDDQSQSLLRV